MRPPKYLQNVLVGTSALLIAGAHVVPQSDQSGPVLTAAIKFVNASHDTTSSSAASVTRTIAAVTKAALDAFTGVVRPLSRPGALEGAFRSYFAFKTSHPNDVR